MLLSVVLDGWCGRSGVRHRARAEQAHCEDMRGRGPKSHESVGEPSSPFLPPLACFGSLVAEASEFFLGEDEEDGRRHTLVQ